MHVTGRTLADATLEGSSVSAICGGPELRARVGTNGNERRFPVIAVELGAGLVARPMRGLRDGTKRVYAVEGTWISLSATLGFGLCAPRARCYETVVRSSLRFSSRQLP